MFSSFFVVAKSFIYLQYWLTNVNMLSCVAWILYLTKQGRPNLNTITMAPKKIPEKKVEKPPDPWFWNRTPGGSERLSLPSILEVFLKVRMQKEAGCFFFVVGSSGLFVRGKVIILPQISWMLHIENNGHSLVWKTLEVPRWETHGDSANWISDHWKVSHFFSQNSRHSRWWKPFSTWVDVLGWFFIRW